MRFFFDANLPVTLLATLDAAYPWHSYDSAHRHGLEDEDDVPLLRRAGELGADLFVTTDLRQMHRPEQRAACRTAGLHWVGLHEPPSGANSLVVVAALTAPIIHAVPLLTEQIAASRAPTSFSLKGQGRESGQVFTKPPELV